MYVISGEKSRENSRGKVEKKSREKRQEKSRERRNRAQKFAWHLLGSVKKTPCLRG